MDTNQTTASPTYAPVPGPRGVFGTGMPASVAFAVAILLFLLPFSEIKCGGTAITNKSGLNFALGNDWKAAGGLGKESMGEMTSKTTGKKEGNAQYFAIGALGLAVLGLLFSFGKSKGAGQGGIVLGILAAGALIGLMVEVKKWFNDMLAKEAADKATEGAESIGLDKMSNSIKPTLGFTPWFYVAVIALLAAAFFCYRRISSPRRP